MQVAESVLEIEEIRAAAYFVYVLLRKDSSIVKFWVEILDTIIGNSLYEKDLRS